MPNVIKHWQRIIYQENLAKFAEEQQVSNPVEELISSLKHSKGMMLYIAAQLRLLAMWDGTESETFTPDGLVTVDHLGDLRTHPLAQQYLEWNRQHAKNAADCIKCGVLIHQQRMEEEQRDSLARTFYATLNAPQAALTFEQKQALIVVFAEGLRKLDEQPDAIPAQAFDRRKRQP